MLSVMFSPCIDINFPIVSVKVIWSFASAVHSSNVSAEYVFILTFDFAFIVGFPFASAVYTFSEYI